MAKWRYTEVDELDGVCRHRWKPKSLDELVGGRVAVLSACDECGMMRMEIIRLVDEKVETRHYYRLEVGGESLPSQDETVRIDVERK